MDSAERTIESMMGHDGKTEGDRLAKLESCSEHLHDDVNSLHGSLAETDHAVYVQTQRARRIEGVMTETMAMAATGACLGGLALFGMWVCAARIEEIERVVRILSIAHNERLH